LRLISPSRDPPQRHCLVVEQTVTLADGSTTKALVPQVYARVKAGDLDGTGTLLAGQVTNLNLSGDMTNTGTVAGRTASHKAGGIDLAISIGGSESQTRQEMRSGRALA
jgi:hypothetical protein